MNSIFLLGVATAITLQVGCGENKPRNVGNEYLSTTLRTISHAESVAGSAAVSSAIQLFRVQNGRYPQSLQELQDKNFLRQIPPPPAGKKWTYDSQAGEVSLVDI